MPHTTFYITYVTQTHFLRSKHESSIELIYSLLHADLLPVPSLPILKNIVQLIHQFMIFSLFDFEVFEL